MLLLTAEIRKKLLANGKANAERSAESGEVFNFHPVVKLFCPWNGATWLLSELDPAEPDIAFGLCDLGMGSPELGSVRISEMEAVRGPGGLRIERDMHWQAEKSLSAYADEARRLDRTSSQ